MKVYIVIQRDYPDGECRNNYFPERKVYRISGTGESIYIKREDAQYVCDSENKFEGVENPDWHYTVEEMELIG